MSFLKIAFLSSAVLEFFSSISIAFIAIYLGMGFINTHQTSAWWQLNDNINLQHGLFILFIAPEFFLPIRELSTYYHNKSEAIGAAKEIIKLLQLKTTETIKKINFKEKIKTINCKHLSFKYNNRNNITLNNISLKIKEKQKIIIVGKSGAGKTTFINLLLKFLYTENKYITINNTTHLNEISEESWLDKVSYLGQHNKLIKGTIRSNLCFAKQHATDKELWQSLKMTSMRDTIIKLPNKLDTQIKEYNIGLSSGQIQRLALSRAYLKNHEILLLDEPTANLDNETQKIIIDSINKFCKEKIVIMLSHNLKYISDKHDVIVLNQGKIEQSGKTSELLRNKNSLFYKLYSESIS